MDYEFVGELATLFAVADAIGCPYQSAAERQAYEAELAAAVADALAVCAEFEAE